MKVLALLLLLSLPAKAGEYEQALFGLAASRGGEPFQEERAPPGFVTHLKNKGLEPSKLTNHAAYLEYQLYKTRLPLPVFGADEDEARGLPLWGLSLGGKSLFRKGDPDRRGLLIHGFDLGGGDDLDREAEEPYLSEGVDRLLDWDVRFKVRQDSLGFKAKYRHPESIERLTVSFRAYMDVPETFGLGEARDAVFSFLGKEPKEEKSGYDAGVSAVLDEHWGVSLGHGERETVDSWSRHYSLGAGYTPLGRNEAERWNYSVFAGANYVERDTPQTGREEGFGYTAGLAWSRALDDVPIPWVREYFWLERAKASLSCSDSELDPFSIRAAAGLSARLTKHLRLSGGAGCTYTPKTDELDFDTSTGFDVKF